MGGVRLELRQIRYFLAVAAARHFTNAAEHLGISRSTLSSQIKELERDLGAPLLDRSGRAVRLTVAGEAFLGPARATIREASLCRSAVAEVLGGMVGHLRVGVSHVFSTRLIPDVVAALGGRHPGIELSITRLAGLGVRNGVVGGRFDVGISYAFRLVDGVEVEPLFDDELVVVAPQCHPLTARGPIRLAELDGQRMALTDQDCTARRGLDRSLEEAGVALKVLLEISDIHAILEIIRRGGCASVLPRQSIVHPAGLEVIEIIEPTIPLPAKIFWPRDVHRSAAAARAFREAILQAAPAALPRPDGRPRPA